jgi:hypothetical protein
MTPLEPSDPHCRNKSFTASLDCVSTTFHNLLILGPERRAKKKNIFASSAQETRAIPKAPENAGDPESTIFWTVSFFFFPSAPMLASSAQTAAQLTPLWLALGAS